ncbi:putative nuclease HARBI1 [Diretmus argenteus]
MCPYTLKQADIEFLASLLRPQLEHTTKRSHALTVEEQLLIALRFYASGSFYQVIGDGMRVQKSAVGFVIHTVSSALASLVNQFVKFPTDQEKIKQVKLKFYDIARMTNTIAVLDCTHVHIQGPREREWEYVNRKGRHSINVQLMGNADLIITNCVVKWPGSVHDARILRESHIFRNFQENPPDGIILGDSAYPLLPWLMTHFAMATNDAEGRFNCSHGTTRDTIERLNGVLKRRFACLNYLRLEPQRACNIILACIVLHNIAEKRKVPHWNEDADHSQPQDEDSLKYQDKTERITSILDSKKRDHKIRIVLIWIESFEILGPGCNAAVGQIRLNSATHIDIDTKPQRP